MRLMPGGRLCGEKRVKLLLSMVSDDVRRRYAEEISAIVKGCSVPLLKAFANVPREGFLGSGPWRVLSRISGKMQPQVTEVMDPAELYHDVAVLLDPARNLTNGNPTTLAPWLDGLNLSPRVSVFHLGCGTGYYTAIMAEMVGPAGRVTAVEVDPILAARARTNLAGYRNVEVVEGDGGSIDVGPRDAILINAGVTHPRDNWLDNLHTGGILVLPLSVEIGTPNVGKGLVLKVAKLQSGYTADFFPAPVMIQSCSGVRDPALAKRLGPRFASGSSGVVKSLRRDAHPPEADCWLHTSAFCLSHRPVNNQR